MTTTAPEPPGATAPGVLALEHITPSKTNPRRRFDAGRLEELTASVREHGVLQPVLVRPAGNLKYELVAGERRYRAALAAGLKQLPVTVRELSDVEVLEIQVVENLQRDDVHPLEEAEGYRRLLATERYSVARIAERVGRSAVYVYDRLRLLHLIEPAQKLFLDGRITAAHAVILSRLKPSEQERAIDPDHGGLWEHERTLFTPDEDEIEWPDEDGTEDPYRDQKTRTARELQGWVDQHVRFDPAAEDVPDLFPETAAVVATAKEEAEKIVAITYDYQIPPEARGGGKILSCRSWKPADEKPCAFAVTGVIAIGAGRGKAFRVCTEKKKCTIHWGAEIREAAKFAKAAAAGGTVADKVDARREAERREEEKRQAKRKRYEKTIPHILKALAEVIVTLPANATGKLADEILRDKHGSKKAAVPRGTTAEDFVRHLAYLELAQEAEYSWNFESRIKPFAAIGVDIKALMDQHAPVEKQAPAPKTSTKEKAAAPAKKKAAKQVAAAGGRKKA